MKRRVLLLAPLLLLFAGVAREAGAERILTNDLAEIVPWARHVVRGRVDRAERRIQVLERYRGAEGLDSLRVENLRQHLHLGVDGPGWPDRAYFERERRGEEPPQEAVLLLEELDGRFYLVERRTPLWITPHSAMRYLHPNGEVLAYRQVINPGGTFLVAEHEASREGFLEALERLVREKPYRGERGRQLGAADAARFQGVLGDDLDYYGRGIRGGYLSQGSDLSRYRRLGERLLRLAREADGLLRVRAWDAYLLLGRREVGLFGLEDEVEQAARRWIHEVGPEPMSALVLADLEGGDVCSNHALSARLGVACGDEAAAKVVEILERRVRTGSATLQSQAYWALAAIGRKARADELLAERGR